MHWNFKKDHPYFVLDPEGDGISYFETIEERDEFAGECIKKYLDDTWDEEVVNVVAGVVTHSAQQTDYEPRPAELDEDGYDDDGFYWNPDIEYRCNYQLLPIGIEFKGVFIDECAPVPPHALDYLSKWENNNEHE